MLSEELGLQKLLEGREGRPCSAKVSADSTHIELVLNVLVVFLSRIPLVPRSTKVQTNAITHIHTLMLITHRRGFTAV